MDQTLDLTVSYPDFELFGNFTSDISAFSFINDDLDCISTQ